MSVRIESTCAIPISVLTDILSRTVSKLLGNISARIDRLVNALQLCR